MDYFTRLRGVLLGFALAGTAALFPGDAWAITVDCENENGSCTVSTDGGSDSEFCTCTEGGAAGSTGGTEYQGLTMAELQAVCLDLLDGCEPFVTGTESDSVGTSVGSTVTTVGTTDSTDTGTSTTGATTGETEGATTGETDGATSETTGDTSGGVATTESTTGGPTSESVSETNGSTVSVTVGETAGNEESSSEGSGGGSAGAEEDAKGCSCNTGPGSGPVAALALLGLLGIRRRRTA